MAAISLKSTARHLRNSLLYSVINVIGLSIGICAMLLAILFWRHEESFDTFHPNFENLYRVTTTLRENKDSQKSNVGATGQPQGPAFVTSIPEVKSFTRIMGGDIFTDIQFENKILRLRPLWVDDNFLSIFNFPLLHGSRQNALSEKHYVVLTESMALKFFDRTDVVGQTVDNNADPSTKRLDKPLTISAVVKDPPKNSSLQFDMLVPFSHMQVSFTDEAWLNAYLGTFITLTPGANLTDVIKKMNAVYADKGKVQLAENIKNYGFDPEISYGLQNITDIHLNPLMRTQGNAEAGVINGSDPVYSIVFLVISGFILLMAAINFINISIAGSIRRSKEIGIRKITGASALDIISQFLFDSAILCFISFLLAGALVPFLLPLMNELAGKDFVFRDIYSPSVLMYFVLLLILLVATSGLYPAVVLSRFKPVQVLYNNVLRRGSGWPAKMLVIFQFTPAIVLLIAAMLFYRQMNFIRSKDLGYNPSYVIRTNVYGDRDYKKIVTYLQNQLAKEPSIERVSFGNAGFPFWLTTNQKKFEAIHKTVDEHYLSLMEIPVVRGVGFDKQNIQTDAVIVNEAFVKAAGLQDPIGQILQLGEYYNHSKKRIIGVIRDFHFQSSRVAIQPMVFFARNDADAEMWVKVNRASVKQGIAALDKIYKDAMPDAVFEYNFLDELNAREFQMEQRWQRTLAIATAMSFVVCLMGLFGLAHLAAYQRVKEIGIRKVLGATVSQIVVLMSSAFLKLVLLSFVIAVPLAWIVMQQWLKNFAYRAEIGAGIFFAAGMMTVVVAFFAVLFQLLRAAMVNPVVSLKE
jgi:putative ABC transport system permease protein